MHLYRLRRFVVLCRLRVIESEAQAVVACPVEVEVRKLSGLPDSQREKERYDLLLAGATDNNPWLYYPTGETIIVGVLDVV